MQLTEIYAPIQKDLANRGKTDKIYGSGETFPGWEILLGARAERRRQKAPSGLGTALS